MVGMGGLFEELPFLCVGLILLFGLLVFLGLAINNFQKDGQRWATIAGVFGGIFAILFTASTISTLKVSPELEISKPVRDSPFGGVAYVSIMVSNKGEMVGKNCMGEIVLSELWTEPVKVVWGGGSEAKDILPYGGSARLYLLVAATSESPITVVPYYRGVHKPPYSTDPWRIEQGNYNLELTLRCENAKPESVQLDLSVGQTWEDLKCHLK